MRILLYCDNFLDLNAKNACCEDVFIFKTYTQIQSVLNLDITLTHNNLFPVILKIL